MASEATLSVTPSVPPQVTRHAGYQTVLINLQTVNISR